VRRLTRLQAYVRGWIAVQRARVSILLVTWERVEEELLATEVLSEPSND
jgi:hypothetical protein